jgi:CheY-like chemotaxis protein
MQDVPIFSFPCTIIVVDDDEFTIRTLKKIIGDDYPLKPFSEPAELITFLNHEYVSPISDALLLHEFSEHEYTDTPNNALVNFDINNIANLAKQTKRYDEIGILIVDYNMPQMNGVELCKQLKHLPFKKILLTADTDYEKATDAFNEQLIDCFIPKSTPDLHLKVSMYVDLFRQRYFAERTNNIKLHLEASTPLPNVDPVFIGFFNTWLSHNKINEYYLIDKHLSYLLIDKNQDKSYFIVHTDKSLDEFVKMYEDDEYAKLFILAVKQRELIPYFTPNQLNISKINANSWRSYFKKPNVISGKTRYYWHHHKLS